MTDLCHNLDPYLAGDLPDAEAQRFERHALTCAACDAALALPADVAGALSALADEPCPPAVLAAARSAADGDWPQAWSRELRALSATPCPPDVLAAALNQTRRAADRAPAPPRHRQRHAWALALAALVAIGVSWAALRTAPDAPVQVAQGTPEDAPAATAPVSDAERDPVAPATSPPASGPIGPLPLVADAQPPATAPPPSVTEPAASAPLAPRSETAEGTPGATDSTPGNGVATEFPVSDLAERQPTAQEIEDAQRDLALAFALVADAQATVRTQVRERTQALSTLDHAPLF